MDMIEGHPIPQDITGFQFRLIGDMTVKQFAYLAVGLVLGWIFFSLQILFLIKFSLAAACALGGIILAFVPIQGRSADTMIMLFFRALFKPNQYAYKKMSQGPTTVTQQQPSIPVAKEEKKPKEQAKTFFGGSPVPINLPAPIPSQHLASPPPPPAPAIQNPMLQVPVAVVSAPEPVQQNPIPNPIPVPEPPQPPPALENRLESTLLESPSASIPQPPPPPQEPPSQTVVGETSRVKNVPEPLKKKVGIPFAPTDIPNLISGIIEDPRGNVLPNILIEVKDKEDNPVRAFKTNALGQFASATPLLNGTYTMTFEDSKKQHSFDSIELIAEGAIIPPLEVISIDQREELRKSLFGG